MKYLSQFLIPLFFMAWASVLFSQTNQACLECHSDNSLTMTKNKKEISLYVNDKNLSHSAHSKVACVACHTGFNPDDIPHKEKITPVNCLSCHNKDLLKHQFHTNMVNATGTDGKKDVSCKGCHGTHDVQGTKNPGAKFSTENLVNACGSCHGDVKNKFIHSAHAEALDKGSKDAPNCLTCHQSNITRVTTALDSVQLKISQEKVCISCHLDNPNVADKTVRGTKFIESYEKSIHGAQLRGGNAKAANCVDCHGSHEMNKSIVESSRVNKLNIQAVCAKCHDKIEHEFNTSVHATAVVKGNKDAPVCTDCHGEHNILKHDDPNSPVSARNLSQQVCGTCHASVKLSQKYGLSTDRFKTFSDSFHGLAARGGSVEAVNCASCHGAHNIKPSSDSTSTVSKSNLTKTCGKCHPGANNRFTVGSVHSSVEEKEDQPILYWIANFYIWMIVVVVGGMFLHNFFDFLKKIRRKLAIQRGEIEEDHVGHALYLRMTVNERIQHGTLAISFILLVITGFMLRYPEAWWVVSIRNLSDNAFEWRSWIHRIAGVIMVVASLYHIIYVTFTARGRQLIKDLVPKAKDMFDAIHMMKYNFGLLKNKPKFARFGYVEKAEYWALVWGTIVMALTGAIMWFENTSMGLFTKLGWDISRTIHFYEAILATLAIIVWHFYFVIFNPDMYPMNLAWLTGKISEKEMLDEHALELDDIKKREAEAEKKNKPTTE